MALSIVYIAILLVGVAVGDDFTPHYVNCENREGVVEFGCWGYSTCTNGKSAFHRCPDDQIYDRDSHSCVPKTSAHVACNQVMSCTGLTEGRHATLGDKCETYILCLGGQFFGRFYCPPGTVFSDILQACAYPGNVLPPCGTGADVLTTPSPIVG